jgi:phage terminase large subunit GpA-like protein
MATGNFSAAAVKLLLALAESITPAPDLPISEWVDQGHIIIGARTNSPRPGPFSFEGVEYLREPLDRLHPDDPCTRVAVKGGAQSGKSSIGQLWMGWSVANNPRSFAVGLPADGEVGKYNDLKLQPIIEDSPVLTSKVRPVSTKADQGSSTRVKRLYTGATIRIFNLSSPKELQMISTGNLILEEVANALKDVGNRGSPVKQARERQAAYSVIGSKELMVSTPGTVSNDEDGEVCEVTLAYDAGDQRRFFGKCPACGDYFCMEPEAFKASDPHWGHHFGCPSCGVPLCDQDRAAWRIHGVWLPTFRSANADNPAPDITKAVAAADIETWRARDCEGRQPSYYVWQAMCGLISLDKIARTIAEAKTPEDLKALEQQTYGRAWTPVVEAIDWEELHRLREKFEPGVVPSGAGLLTGFCDVQGGWLQWGVIAWGPFGEWWVIDRGIIEGDTAGDDVWKALDEVTRRTYRHHDGGELPIEGFGIDTGFRTQRVYAFVRGRHNCFATDGRADWDTPYFGRPKPQRIVQNGRVVGRVRLYPVGTWGLKSLLAWSLSVSLEAKYGNRAQGRGHWSESEDEVWCQQMTSEALCEEKNAKTGATVRWWKKVRDRNEELDIWVGARALAWNFGVGAPRRDGQPGEAIDWAERAARFRIAPDLFAGGRPVMPGVVSAMVAADAIQKSSSPPPSGGWLKRKTL